jgi:hypothetical protein
MDAGKCPSPWAEKAIKIYFGRVIYEDAKAKTVGTVTARGKTQAGFEATMTRVLNDTTLARHMATPAGLAAPGQFVQVSRP